MKEEKDEEFGRYVIAVESTSGELRIDCGYYFRSSYDFILGLKQYREKRIIFAEFEVNQSRLDNDTFDTINKINYRPLTEVSEQVKGLVAKLKEKGGSE